MKYALIAVLAVLFGFDNAAFCGQTYVKSHTTKTGSYVPGHYRTTPDSTQRNNWSAIPNTNPHTGKPGWIYPTR